MHSPDAVTVWSDHRVIRQPESLRRRRPRRLPWVIWSPRHAATRCRCHGVTRSPDCPVAAWLRHHVAESHGDRITLTPRDCVARSRCDSIESRGHTVMWWPNRRIARTPR